MSYATARTPPMAAEIRELRDYGWWLLAVTGSVDNSELRHIGAQLVDIAAAMESGSTREPLEQLRAAARHLRLRASAVASAVLAELPRREAAP